MLTRLIRSTTALLLAATLLPSLRLLSQESETQTSYLERTVRFKLATDWNSGAGLDRITEEISGAIGPVTIAPWLDPVLLHYSARNHPGMSIDGIRGRMPHESLARIVTVSWQGEIDREKVIALLSDHPGVEYAEEIALPTAAYTPNDPSVRSTQQWHHTVIRTPEAWDVARGRQSVVIAILDTGIEPGHQELAPVLWRNPGESGAKATNGIDDDGNGKIDDSWGWDFGGSDGRTPDNDPRAVNDPHGTHVAGIAGAAGDNGIGGAGVAWGVRLMAVKIGSDALKPKLPHGYDGILYAAAMGADIINCSWGAAESFSRAEQELVRYVRNDLGVVIVGAAGNDGRNQAYYPASYDGVISVASTRENDRKAGTSNYHHTVDLCAPGEFVWATWTNNGHAVESGTSMAAPMVAGAAALLRGHDPTLSTEEIAMIIEATTDDIGLVVGQEYDGLLGSGRLNVYRALSRLRNERAAQVIATRIVDGDGDGYIEQGEPVRLEFDVRNVLAATESAVVSLLPVVPGSVTITRADVDLGAMQSRAVATTPSDAFLLSFPESTPVDSRVALRVSVRTPDHLYREVITLDVYQTWGTTALNDITASFNGVGNVAYNGTNRDQGDGFYWGGEGSLIWHGGLLIGTGSDRLADVVRVGPSSQGTDNGFRMIEPYRTERTDNDSLEIGRARFADNEELGIETSMTTVEYASDPNVLLVLYDLRNTGTSDVTGLYAGLYVDWDLITDGGFDQASLDQEYRLGFVRNSKKTDLTAGIALLSSQGLNYTAVDNLSDGVPSSFTDQKKWTMLSSGLYRETSPVDIDASMVIGAGPFSVAAGSSATVAFAYVLGEDHVQLRQATDRARDLFDVVTGVPVLSDGPTTMVTPHPTDRFVTVRIPAEITHDAEVRLFDPLGRLVMSSRSVAGRSANGRNVRFDLGELPSGLYRVEVSDRESRYHRPLLLRK